MVSHVRPAQWQQWLDAAPAGSRPLLLDVREPWELQTASVTAQGFELLHIPMGSVPQQLATLDPERPMACLCHHGARTMSVAAFLLNNGFEDVSNITGGIDAWSRERDPSVPFY